MKPYVISSPWTRIRRYRVFFLWQVCVHDSDDKFGGPVAHKRARSRTRNLASLGPHFRNYPKKIFNHTKVISDWCKFLYTNQRYLCMRTFFRIILRIRAPRFATGTPCIRIYEREPTLFLKFSQTLVLILFFLEIWLGIALFLSFVCARYRIHVYTYMITSLIRTLFTLGNWTYHLITINYMAELSVKPL